MACSIQALYGQLSGDGGGQASMLACMGNSGSGFGSVGGIGGSGGDLVVRIGGGGFGGNAFAAAMGPGRMAAELSVVEHTEAVTDTTAVPPRAEQHRFANVASALPMQQALPASLARAISRELHLGTRLAKGSAARGPHVIANPMNKHVAHPSPRRKNPTRPPAS